MHKTPDLHKVELDVPCKPSSGIYFVIPFPDGSWKLRAFHATAESDPAHLHVWEDTVAKEVADEWAGPRGKTLKDKVARVVRAKALYRKIAAEYDMFPRGRVVVGEAYSGCDPTTASIYHGDNLKETMRISRADIERAFGLERPIWVFDEHEQCSNVSAYLGDRHLKSNLTN